MYGSRVECDKGYQLVSNLLKDENDDLLTDSMKGLKNYFCQLLNLHGVNDVRQTEMHTAEPFASRN
jgi:hypothetical protein